jgi:hypothetical protein
MTSFKLKSLVAAAALAFVSVPAVAGVTWYPFPNITGFQDDNLDFLYQDDGDGILEIGESLIAIFEVSETFGVFGGGPTPIAPNELTGVAAISVLGFADLDDSDGDGDPTTGPQNDIIFGPYAGGLNAILALGTDPDVTVIGGGAGGGAIVAMYDDTTPNLQLTGTISCTSLGGCVDQATDGELFQVDGFFGDPDEFWVAFNAQTNTNVVVGAPASSKFGVVNFALSTAYNRDGAVIPQSCGGNPLCDGDGQIDVIGSGDILGGQGLPASLISDGLVARSDFDYQKTIPEPATLALFGMGLLGIGASLRKRRTTKV